MDLVAALMQFGIWFCAGLLSISSGRMIRKEGLTRVLYTSYGDTTYWQRQLERWGLGQQETPDLVPAVRDCWGEVYAFGRMYSGVALSSVTLCAFLLSWLGGSLPVLNMWFWWAGFVLSYLLGIGIGYIVGVYRLRTRVQRTVRYGDLHRRELTDYISWLWPLLSGAFVVFLFVTTALYAPSVGPVLSISFPRIVHVSHFPLALWVGDVILLVVLVIGYIVMSAIAQLPRLLVIADPLIARQADDMLRSKILVVLQGMLLYSLAFIGMLQLGILSNNYQLFHNPFLVFTFCLILFVGAVGITLPTLSRDKVGGRVTGWPWQAGHTFPAGAVEQHLSSVGEK